MQKILVPTDFSECALNALMVAADIAKRDGKAEIHLVHVYERPISGITIQFEIDNIKLRAMRDQVAENMQQLAKNEFLKGCKVISHNISDKQVWEVLKVEALGDVDLIVMGTHGIKGWQEFFIGSNTQKVVQMATCPVLAIKKPIKNFSMNNMVFASNFYGEAATVFVKIKKLANLFSAKIHLLRVNTPGNFETSHISRKLMNDFAKRFYLDNYTVNIYNDNTVEDGILNFTKNVDTDVIAIETHGRTGISHLINGSIAEDVVNHLDAPVLSVKIKQAHIEHGVIYPAYSRKKPIKVI